MATNLSALLPPFIDIPAGPFLMGTLDNERSALALRYGGTRESYAEESPQHIVEAGAFAISQVPVTNALYAVFQQATDAHRPITWAGHPPSYLANHPVVDVSWHDAHAFCRWLGEQLSLKFRLPTEAEWEKAARGEDGRIFPWGDAFDVECCNVKESNIGSTTPVGSNPRGASPYNVLDLAGNVWEWTQSLQAAYPYRSDDGRNEHQARIERRLPRFLQRLARTAPHHASPQVETRRVLRGGCYANPEGFARTACRLRLQPDSRTPFLGIRLVRET